jgi:hypothetical protein
MHPQKTEEHLAAGICQQNTKRKGGKHRAHQHYQVHRVHDSAFALRTTSQVNSLMVIGWLPPKLYRLFRGAHLVCSTGLDVIVAEWCASLTPVYVAQ